MDQRIPPIIQVGDVLLSSDILTECFCCDLDACKGQCCVEGDSGAPLTLDEVGQLESVLDDVWPQLSAKAQATIDHQGVAYTDSEGDLVTSIVNGREGRTAWCKSIACALYPIREKRFSNGTSGLHYHRWSVCHAAVKKGRELNLRIYQFLKGPLIRRFGQAWYDELCEVAAQLGC